MVTNPRDQVQSFTTSEIHHKQWKFHSRNLTGTQRFSTETIGLCYKRFLYIQFPLQQWSSSYYLPTQCIPPRTQKRNLCYHTLKSTMYCTYVCMYISTYIKFYVHTYIKFYVCESSYHRTNYKWSYNTVDPSILDTLGPERPVLIIKVSSFQGLRMYYGKV